jgi:hypothetical protein
MRGLEPLAFGLRIRCSSQLSYIGVEDWARGTIVLMTRAGAPLCNGLCRPDGRQFQARRPPDAGNRPNHLASEESDFEQVL